MVAGRFAILPRLGLAPSVAEVVRGRLDEAIGQSGSAVVLDAGCGRVSFLRPFRGRIAQFVGADLHPPTPGTLPHLDEFRVADLCTDQGAFEAGSFDVILSSFTVEHFADPAAAFRNMRGWLRPGGRLIITTVNRRHPLVGLYLLLPARLRHRLQRLVKASEADAHPLVGACNTVAAIEGALRAADFAEVQVTTVSHLARAWGRHLVTFVPGLLGDLAAQPFASRRSTIVAEARA